MCDCGKQVAVPRFRALKDLERAQPTPGAIAADAGSEWNAVRGILFSFGLLVSLISAVVVCYHLYTIWVVWDGGESWRQEHLREMVETVDYMGPAEALGDFQDMASKGLTVDGVPPWAQVSAVRESARQWMLGALVALVVGIVSVTASLLGTKRARAK